MFRITEKGQGQGHGENNSAETEHIAPISTFRKSEQVQKLIAELTQSVEDYSNALFEFCQSERLLAVRELIKNFHVAHIRYNTEDFKDLNTEDLFVLLIISKILNEYGELQIHVDQIFAYANTFISRHKMHISLDQLGRKGQNFISNGTPITLIKINTTRGKRK